MMCLFNLFLSFLLIDEPGMMLPHPITILSYAAFAVYTLVGIGSLLAI